MEAWCWLEANGLIMPEPGPNGPNGYKVLTRRAHQFANEEAFLGFVASQQLPKEIIHPTIRNDVWYAFIRADYDTAVTKGMKAVEIAVRTAGNFAPETYGVDLMRQAFNVDHGPLRDPNLPRAEQEAASNLFAGTIGRYKNPQSHRHVGLDDPEEAVEIILLASQLLRIVDKRKAADAAAAAPIAAT